MTISSYRENFEDVMAGQAIEIDGIWLTCRADVWVNCNSDFFDAYSVTGDLKRVPTSPSYDIHYLKLGDIYATNEACGLKILVSWAPDWVKERLKRHVSNLAIAQCERLHGMKMAEAGV